MTKTPIRFADLFRYWRGLPHQIAAVELLGQQIPASLLNRENEWFQVWSQDGKQLPAVTPAERTQWRTSIRALNLSQPDASTCQATCIGMAVADPDIPAIRRKLLDRGAAGDPGVMASVIRTYRRPYQLEMNASLGDVYRWLQAGEFLITHGWFTRSGHVICLDGLRATGNGRHDLDVKDPWSEFDPVGWGYSSRSTFYDGFYSDRLIYATCVAGVGRDDAKAIYRRDELDADRRGMWVHRFLVA